MGLGDRDQETAAEAILELKRQLPNVIESIVVKQVAERLDQLHRKLDRIALGLLVVAALLGSSLNGCDHDLRQCRVNILIGEDVCPVMTVLAA